LKEEREMKMVQAMVMLVAVLAVVGTPAVQAQSYGSSEARNEGEVLGCYNEVEHTCDCSVTEMECAGIEDSFWAPFCSGKCSAPEGVEVVAGCLKSPENDGESHSCSCSTPSSYCEETGNLVTEACACFLGCYDQDTHSCDCGKSREECSESPNAFMTSLCNAKCVDQASFMPGCLDFDEDGSHGCDCSISEEACRDDESDVWTDSCDCSVEPVLGCYNSDSGACDCEVSESECNASGDENSWSGLCTNMCTHGDNVVTGCLVFEESGRHACTCDVPTDACVTEEGMPPKIYTDACTCFPGCYDQETHMCDCESTAEECNANSTSFFTAMCNTKCEDPGRHKAGCLKGFTEITTENTEGTHRCDCELSEDECAAEEGFWTDACQCYTPAGCYDIVPHKCDCSKTEDECLAGNVEGEDTQFYWTTGCVGTSGSMCGAREMGVRPTGDAPGCYNSTLHRCNCDLTEEQCQSTVDVVTWTPSCRCPARSPIGPN